MADGDVCSNCRVVMGANDPSFPWDQGAVCKVCYNALMRAKQRAMEASTGGRMSLWKIVSIIVLAAGGGLAVVGYLIVGTDTGANHDRQLNSTITVLQTLRSQINLFKIQHEDVPPAETMLAALLTGKTNTTDTATTTSKGVFGPYLQAFPANALNGFSTVVNVPGAKGGWVYKVNQTDFKLMATDANGTTTVNY